MTDLNELQPYIGCKFIEAKPMTLGEYNEFKGWTIPENEDPENEGYLVKYSDDYVSWSPSEAFEKAYISLEDPTRITPDVVDNFIDWPSSDYQRMGCHTVVEAVCANGFVILDSAACVDPDNYNEEIGRNIALKKIKEKLWFGLGFVLSWAKYGVKRDA